jgi:ankyrin repeat protein
MNPSERDRGGRIALHYAAVDGMVNEVKALLAGGHDVNDRDYDGWTPLHCAAQHQRADVVRVLVAAGADINARERQVGNTPLHRAVMSSRGAGDTIEALLSAGADPELVNNLGDSARDWAERIANYDVKQHLPPRP